MSLRMIKKDSKHPHNKPLDVVSILIDFNRQTIKLAYCMLFAFALFTAAFILILIIYLK